MNRKRAEEQLDAEMSSYAELVAQEKTSGGMSAREARRAAGAEFGSVERVKEEVRSVRFGVWVETFGQDLRHGARMLRRDVAFTIVAAVTLGLGIGANTALFSMVDSFLLRPLPVEEPDQITVIAFQQKNGEVITQLSLPDIDDISAETSSALSDVAGYAPGLDGLNIDGKSTRVLTTYVTGNYFTTLGLKPAIGRLLLPSEGKSPGGDPVLVLGYDFWQTHFGGSQQVIGRSVNLNGHPLTIVGVGPKGFRGIEGNLEAQAFLPYNMARLETFYPADFMTNRAQRNLFTFARLRHGETVSQVQPMLTVVAQRLAAAYPVVDKDITLRIYLERSSRPEPDANGPLVRTSILFLTLAAFVLALACMNVGNILLVRATTRQREMATRTALGAPRWRLLRQLMTESLLVALIGGVAGVGLGIWGSNALSSVQIHTSIPVIFDFRFDWRVFLYALGAAIATGIGVGIVPAIRASRGNLSELLHEGSRGSSGGKQRLRTGLVVAQVAGSLMLLIVAGLFARSLGKVQQVNLGFEPDHIMNVTLDPNEIGYNEAQVRQFDRALLERVRALPGVTSATLAFSVPMGYVGNGDALQIDGYVQPAGDPPPNVGYNQVATDYFRTMGIPLLEGRDFTERDDQNSPFVAMVNQAMAKKFWPGQEAIGREFKLASDLKHPVRVVGIARDSRFGGVKGQIKPYFYIPLAQNWSSLATLQVRAVGDPSSMIPLVTREIDALAPGMPLLDAQTMNQALYTLNGMLIYELGAVLTAALGGLGLVLAVVGVYGVISIAAAQRTREIGIRVALGAQRGDVLMLILRHGLTIVVIGLGVGLAGAFGAGRLLKNFLVGVSPTDPVTFAGVSILLAAVALVACYVPARRAMRVDPVVALRHE